MACTVLQLVDRLPSQHGTFPFEAEGPTLFP